MSYSRMQQEVSLSYNAQRNVENVMRRGGKLLDRATTNIPGLRGVVRRAYRKLEDTICGTPTALTAQERAYQDFKTLADFFDGEEKNMRERIVLLRKLHGSACENYLVNVQNLSNARREHSDLEAALQPVAAGLQKFPEATTGNMEYAQLAVQDMDFDTRKEILRRGILLSEVAERAHQNLLRDYCGALVRYSVMHTACVKAREFASDTATFLRAEGATSSATVKLEDGLRKIRNALEAVDDRNDVLFAKELDSKQILSLQDGTFPDFPEVRKAG